MFDQVAEVGVGIQVVRMGIQVVRVVMDIARGVCVVRNACICDASFVVRDLEPEIRTGERRHERHQQEPGDTTKEIPGHPGMLRVGHGIVNHGSHHCLAWR
ncbi:MAG: hypothetical protein AB7Q01_16235 [Gammaproteobacteria bacterium]